MKSPRSVLKTGRALLRLAALLALFACLAACGADKKEEKKEGAKGSGTQSAAPAAPPATTVKVQTLKAQNVPIFNDYVGRTDSSSNVQIPARVEGYLLQINFQEGSVVKENDLLFVIDPSEYQQKVNGMQADVERNQALLIQAQKDQLRYGALVKQGAISQDEYDQKVTSQRQLQAQVDQAKAALADAKIKLGYTKVYSPLTGRIGKSNYKVGAFVGRGTDTVLAEVSSLDKAYVNFSVSEKEYLIFAKRKEELKSQGQEMKPVPVTLVLADNSIYPQQGFVDMADRAVDPSTGTLGVRAEFPNPDGMIKPGMFAKVRIKFADLPDAVTVPQAAVVDVQGMKSVFVVGPDNKVENRPITVGPNYETSVVVEKGLKAGETIVVDGVQKVRAGDVVNPVPTDAKPAAAGQ